MKIVSSVGLILFDWAGRLLLLRELESKLHYGKVAGMLSVPIKTVEQGEVSSQTLRRLLIDEIGVPVHGRIDFFNRLYIKLNDAYTESIFVYFGVCKSSFVAQPRDANIEHFGWMLPRDIIDLNHGQTRLEVDKILCVYLSR